MAPAEHVETAEIRKIEIAPARRRKGVWRRLRNFMLFLIFFPFVLMGVLSLWITLYPPNLDRFLPQVTRYLSQESGFDIALDGLTLRGGFSLAVEGSHLSFSLPENATPFLQAQTLLLRFSPSNWMKGNHSVELVLEKADIQVRRDEGGQIFLGHKDIDSLRKQAKKLAGKGHQPLLSFSSVLINDSRVTWQDYQVSVQEKPLVLSLSHVDLGLQFLLDQTFRLSVAGEIEAKGKTTRFSLKGGQDGEGRWIGDMMIEQLVADALRPYLASLGMMQDFSCPINLEASLLWDDLNHRFLSFWRMQVGWGIIRWPKLFRWPLPITSLMANGSLAWEKGETRWEVGQFDLDNIHGKANGYLLLTGLGGEHPLIHLEADAGGVPVNKAKFYYPVGIMSPALVHWLDNALKNGIVNHARLDVKGPLADFPFERPANISDKAWEIVQTENQFSVTGEVSGLSLHFFPGILPLTNVRGEVVFDRKSFVGKVEQGHFGNSQKIAGNVHIDDLLQPNVAIEVHAEKADLTTLWEQIVSAPSLSWDQAIGLQGSRLSGQSDLQLDIHVPLGRLDQTTFSGRMDFSGVDVKLPFFDPVFSNVKGWLNLDPKKIGISVLSASFLEFPVHGQINLLDYAVPAQRNFEARFNSVIDEDWLSKWFSPLLGADGEFSGTAPFSLDIQRSAQDPAFKVDARLEADSLTILGTMNWHKPKGLAGEIRGSGTLKLNGMLQLDDIRTSLGNLGFEGDGRWDLSRTQGELHLTSFHVGKTQGRLGIAQTNPLPSGLGDWLVRADLDMLDLSSLWVTTLHPDSNAIKPIVDREWPRVNLKLKAQRLLLSEGAEATFVLANMDMEKRFLKLHTLKGLWGEGDVAMEGELLWPFQFGSGFYNGWFNIESDDVSALLESLGVQKNFMFGGGGNLNITLDGFIPPGGEFKDYLTGVGHFKLHDGSFARLDFFSTILGLFSLKDLPNLVVGDRPDLDAKGFSYNSFQGDVRFEDSILRTDSLVLDGPSMKIVLSGWVDLPEERIKLLVGIRPLQTLDAILSKVPLLGTLIAGNRGAVLETQFTVEGALGKPKVRIRPISTLAPGIIRDILSPTDEGTVGSADEEEEK